MKLLVACEFSGRVRDAFLAKGHEAWSCDLLKSEKPGPHIQGDVLAVLKDGWEMLIAFPPCTHLAASGARWFREKRADGRQQAAIEFFMALVNAPIPRIAIENPVGIMSSVYRKPDQVIQPFDFGDDASKKTCLWLKCLPPLFCTLGMRGRYACRCGARFPLALGKYGCPNCCGDHGEAKRTYANQTPSGQNALGPSPGRARLRSLTYRGIAQAMADQWNDAQGGPV